AGTFSVWYFNHRMPISPHRYSEILSTVVLTADASDPIGHELLSLARQYTGPQAPSFEDAPALKRALAALPGAAVLIERGLTAYRADHAAGVAALHGLL